MSETAPEARRSDRIKQVMEFEQGALDTATLLLMIFEGEQTRMVNLLRQLQDAAQKNDISEARAVRIYWDESGKQSFREEFKDLKDSFDKAVEKTGKAKTPDGCELIAQALKSLVSSTEAFVKSYSKEPPESFQDFANEFASSGKAVLKDFDTLLSEVKRDILPHRAWGRSGSFEKVLETKFSDVGLSEEYHFLPSGLVIKESALKLIVSVRMFHVTTYAVEKNNILISGKIGGHEVFRDDGDSLVLTADTDPKRDASKPFERKRFKRIK